MGRAVKILSLFVICTVLLFPVFLMLSNSFSPREAFLRLPPQLIPAEYTLQNYLAVFRLQFFPRWVANSMLVVVFMVVVGLFVNGAAGYVFTYGKGRWITVIFWAMMAPIFVTRFVLYVSQFVIIRWMGLRGMGAVLVMSIFWPVGIFLFRNYFRTIPISILESARIDGARDWRIMTSVVFPIARPIVGAAMVFLTMGALGDFIWQMLNLQKREWQTLLVGLVNTTIDIRVVDNIGYDLAVATVLFIPYIVLFGFTSRYFVKGLTVGALSE